MALINQKDSNEKHPAPLLRRFNKWADDNGPAIGFGFNVLQLLVGGVLAVAIAFAGLTMQGIANDIAQTQADVQQAQLEIERAAQEPEFAILETEVVNGYAQHGFRLAKVSGRADELKMRAYDHIELRIEEYPFVRSDLEAYLEPAPAIALDVEGRHQSRGIASQDGYIVLKTGETRSFTVANIVDSLNDELEPLGYKIRRYSACVVADVSYIDVAGEFQERAMYVNPFNMSSILQEWAHEPGCDNPVQAHISLKDFERGNVYSYDELAERRLAAYREQ